MRTELLTVIYDKALRRKDYSATVEEIGGGNTRRGSIDVGKVVNLMSIDASRVFEIIFSFGIDLISSV